MRPRSGRRTQPPRGDAGTTGTRMPARWATAGESHRLGAMSASSWADEQDAARALAPGVERFRAVRRELEASVLPLDTSLDGRRFTFQESLHALAFRLGAYVIVEQAASARLAQVLELEAAQAEG